MYTTKRIFHGCEDQTKKLVTQDHSLSSFEKSHDVMQCFFYPSKNDGKDQETIQSSTTHDLGYHRGK